MTETELYELAEAYLKSNDEKYYIADSNLDNASIVIFQPYPTAFDMAAGSSVSALKTWQGVDLFSEATDGAEDKIGTVYISNVPLYGTDEQTCKLTPIFELLTHSPRVESEYLRAQFKKKMERIIENKSIRLISYKLEFFDRFYKDLIESAEPELVKKLKDRLNEGSLKILMFPIYGLEQIKAFEKKYTDFKTEYDRLIN